MKNYKMLLLDVQNGKVEKVDVEDNLSTFYSLVGCSTIDIVERKIEDEYFTFIVDDEGLLVENPVPSALDKDKQVMLVGNLLISGLSNNYEEEDFSSLTENQLKKIMRHISGIITQREDGMPVLSPILTGVSW